MSERIIVIREQLKDYIHFVKMAYYIYENIDECEQIKNQLAKIYKKYTKHLKEKKISRKEVIKLKWFLDSINTFDKKYVYSEGRKLLNGK